LIAFLFLGEREERAMEIDNRYVKDKQVDAITGRSFTP
jgi:hypothetical protein